jgi:epoxide hydrolase
VSQWPTTATSDVIDVPTGCSVFSEGGTPTFTPLGRAPLRHHVNWSEPARGGHFAAWEQPQLFAEDLLATVRAVHGLTVINQPHLRLRPTTPWGS